MAKRRWSGRAKLSVKRYNAYKKAQKARVLALRNKGLEPYYNASTGEDGSIPLTYREYIEIYAEERNDRLKEIEKGDRNAAGQGKNRQLGGESVQVHGMIFHDQNSLKTCEKFLGNAVLRLSLFIVSHFSRKVNEMKRFFPLPI